MGFTTKTILDLKPIGTIVKVQEYLNSDLSNFAQALQAAIDHAATITVGSTVVMPSGLYQVPSNTHITLPGNNIYTGTGPINLVSDGATTVNIASGHTGAFLDVSNTSDEQIWYTGSIVNLHILGNGSSGTGIHLYGTLMAKLMGVSASGFTGTGGWGLQLDTIGGKLNQGIAIRDSSFSFNERGARLYGVNTTTLENVSFNQNQGTRSQVLLAGAMLDFRTCLFQSTLAKHQVHIKTGPTEVVTVTPVAGNSLSYILGLSVDEGAPVLYTYNSDSSATVAEITAGLAALINGGSQPVFAVDNGTSVAVDVDPDGLYRSLKATVSGTGTMTATMDVGSSHVTLDHCYGESTASNTLVFADPSDEAEHVINLSYTDNFFTSTTLVDIDGFYHRVTIHGIGRFSGIRILKARNVVGGTLEVSGTRTLPGDGENLYDVDEKSLSSLVCMGNGRIFTGGGIASNSFEGAIAPYLHDAIDASKRNLFVLNGSNEVISGTGVRGGSIAPAFTGGEVVWRASGDRFAGRPVFVTTGKTLKIAFATPIPVGSTPGLFMVFRRPGATTFINGAAMYEDGTFASQISLLISAGADPIVGNWSDGMNRFLVTGTAAGDSTHVVFITQADIQSNLFTGYVDHDAGVPYAAIGNTPNTHAINVGLMGDQGSLEIAYVGYLKKRVPSGVVHQLMDMACERWGR